MNVRALRGVCVGPTRHLTVGQIADLDEGVAKYLISIGAVEKHDPAPEPQPEKPAKKAPAKE